MLEKERKLTVWPSALMEGTRLAPLEGEALVPFPMLAMAVPGVQVMVTAKQVLRTKIFSTPLVVLAKFEAKEANATNWPVALRLGRSLRPLPGAPFEMETSEVLGTHWLTTVSMPVQVSRT